MATARRKPKANTLPSWTKPVPITRAAPPMVECENLARLGRFVLLPAAEAERLEREGLVLIKRPPTLRYRLDHRGRIDPVPVEVPPWKR